MNMMTMQSGKATLDVQFDRAVVPKPDRKVLADPVQAQLEAYNAHDLGRFISCFTKDAVFEGSDGEVLIKGHKQIYQVYSGVFSAKKVSAKVVNRFAVGNWVADHQVVSGLSGKKKNEVIAAYRVEKGLISRVKLLR
ncbi:MAG TPA: nuclear transport factor 2 family protein [Thermoanaerobaculia bacterium]|nr:nuclear transport factor 2 family protein [Thermoanaerobaculia bacterium]